MACNPFSYTMEGISNYCKESSFGGIKEVYIALYDDVSAVTLDASGETISAITMSGTSKFKEYKLLKNTGSLTSTLNTSDTSTSYFTNEVSLQFFKQETNKRLEIMALMMSACAVMVKDANGKIWYITKDNYADCTAGSAQTGTAAADANHYELTLTADSAELPYEVSPSFDISSIVQPAQTAE